MKRMVLVFCVFLVLGALVIAGPAQAGQWRFPVGLTYVSGAHDVMKVFKDNLNYLYPGADIDSFEWPVGLSFQPYYLFNTGIGIGGGFGPFMYIAAEDSNDNSYHLYAIPINLSLRYVILPSSNISPYIRAGVSYHIAGGDWVKSRDVGVVGGIGVEIFRKKMVGAGIEFGYDSSTITLEKLQGLPPTPSTEKKVNPTKFFVSVFAVF